MPICVVTFDLRIVNKQVSNAYAKHTLFNYFVISVPMPKLQSSLGYIIPLTTYHVLSAPLRYVV